MATPTAASILKVAKAEVGTQETYSGGHWVNDSKYNKWYGSIPGYSRNGMNYPWCAVFVAWVAEKSGARALYPKTAGCATAVNWFRNAGRFSAYPAVGAQVFFGPGGGTHTGLVYAYDGTYIYTYEGNTNVNGSAEGDGVYKRKRARRDANVYGYGYPKFAEGIKSADPAWAKDAPKAPKPPKAKPVVDLSNIRAARKADMPAPDGHVTHKTDVLRVEKALNAEGLLAAKYVDGSWGTKTQDGYDAFRRAEGYKGADAKGDVGKESLSKLGAKHGWTVKG